MLTLCSKALGQKEKLLVACDTVKMNELSQIMIIYSNDRCYKGLIVKNDILNFTLKGRIMDEMQHEYVLFSSYSESVGCTNYYMFDLERNDIYVSKAVLELEVPFFFSFERNNLTMNLLSYDPLKCGRITKLPFILEKMQVFDIDHIKRLKVYTTINL